MNYVEKIRKFNRHYANVLGKIDQEIYNHPFPLTEARIITEINENHGCTATDIIEKLGIDRGYLSRIIQRFDDENIISKIQSPEDKRQYTLHLTANGNEIYNKLVNDANIGVESMIQSLSTPEVKELVKSMETIESIFSLNQTPNPEILIRPFKPGDVGYVAYIHGKIYSTTYQFGRVFEYYVMKGLSEFLLNPNGGELWVAEVNGEIVGSIAITKTNESVAQLRWFVLDEKSQGLGIGKKLIETALNFCKENQFEHVFLWTVSTLETARHLYKKYNFTLTEEKPNFEWTGSELIEERWDLVLS
ncbi:MULTISPECIES: helix-turn-helix domain-containing GNAT family N-acetyltransferase [Bacillaceae]|uniref:GNAT family N-acetyltransferase n=1 Tax=Gottfriedia luciferensis TaxID=178774 RepID=A0ABX2ZJT6_9BACI|nr:MULTISPECIES: helix-turn-helix domain-containing GNAT family N-acetyltransferase [Bacillaceae]ODG89978.1 GNAT family N-acetyltransferase [Gottfriedia luciferensis]PGZ91291.1 GNAT family N-acetyltransferase [Bacillus sp. AFS029533]SFD12663.1 DNA-binding transcriptional regulator, MarR family [Bacillus sp. UNCCL81]